MKLEAEGTWRHTTQNCGIIEALRERKVNIKHNDSSAITYCGEGSNEFNNTTII